MRVLDILELFFGSYTTIVVFVLTLVYLLSAGLVIIGMVIRSGIDYLRVKHDLTTQRQISTTLILGMLILLAIPVINTWILYSAVKEMILLKINLINI